MQSRLTGSSSPLASRPTGTFTPNGLSVLAATFSATARRFSRRNDSEVFTMLGLLRVPSPPACETAAASAVQGCGPIPSCITGN